MFMVIVITLVLSIMAVFMNATTQQAIKISNQQSGIAMTMIQWHSTAVGVAKYQIPLANMNAVGAVGCSLTDPATYSASVATSTEWTGTILDGANLCNAAGAGTGVFVNNAPTANASLECANTATGPSTPCYTSLPNGYQQNPYTFYSVVYQLAGPPVENFVLTFVPPPPNAGTYATLGNLCLPGRRAAATACNENNNMIMPTHANLFRQLKVGYASSLYFGTVTVAGSLVTPSRGLGASATSLTYIIPGFIPVGSIGIITPF